jgi:hypothetical protein
MSSPAVIATALAYNWSKAGKYASVSIGSDRPVSG